jgi:hypothetical protein
MKVELAESSDELSRAGSPNTPNHPLTLISVAWHLGDRNGRHTVDLAGIIGRLNHVGEAAHQSPAELRPKKC